MAIDTSKVPMTRIDGLQTTLDAKANYILKPQNTDFNDLIETGLYYISTSENVADTVHTPVNIGATVWFLTVHTQVNNQQKAIWQYAHNQHSFLTPYNGRFIYARTYNSFTEGNDGTWSEWYQITGSGIDMPSNKIIQNIFNSSVTTTQQKYIAPANGYIKLTSADVTGIDLGITSIGHIGTVGSMNGANKAIIVPISKGQKSFIQTVSGSATLATSMFIYANSEVPMNERFPISTN